MILLINHEILHSLRSLPMTLFVLRGYSLTPCIPLFPTLSGRRGGIKGGEGFIESRKRDYIYIITMIDYPDKSGL